MQPTSLDITYFLHNVFQLLHFCYLFCFLSVQKLRGCFRIFNRFALIYHSAELVLAAALCFSPESSLLVRGEYYDSFSIVSEIFKDNVTCGFDSAVAHDSSSKFEIDTLEADVVSICKTNVVGSTKTGFQAIGAHTSSKLVEAPVVIRTILGLNMEVGYWRVM